MTRKKALIALFTTSLGAAAGAAYLVGAPTCVLCQIPAAPVFIGAGLGLFAALSSG